MSRVTGNKSAAPKKSSSPLLTGILVGMVVGVALAAGLAWFILKSPSPFVNKEQTVVKPAVEVVQVPVEQPKAKIQTSAVNAASGVEEAKPRFEFYKVLTDKPDAMPAESASKPADKVKTSEAKTADAKVDSKPKSTYLQAGAFSSAADAENLKAGLAMKGLEASVQKANIPGKGDMYRVRVGPFSNEQDMSGARGTLKLNGLDATPTH